MMDRDRIIAEIRELAAKPGGEIARERLRAWMSNENPEVRHAVYGLLRGHSVHVSPALDRDECFRFFQDHLSRALKAAGGSNSALTRHGAAWEIAGWMAGLFRQQSGDKEVLVRLRDWIESMYLNGSADDRETLVNGALEHLFEDSKIRKFFSGWKKDPV